MNLDTPMLLAEEEGIGLLESDDPPFLEGVEEEVEVIGGTLRVSP